MFRRAWHPTACATMPKNGDVVPLKAAAGEIVPIVRKHLDRAKLLEG